MTVGVKELKDRLTYYLGLAKRGDRVIVTDRGRPVAVLHSFDKEEENASLEEKLAVAARQGLLRFPRKTGKFRQGVARPVIKGKPLSETVIEERR